MNKDMQSQLHDYYSRTFPNRSGMRITDLTSISAGWESDMYSFDVEYGPAGKRQREELILRIYPGDDAHEKSAREFHGMSQLYEAGYPVPQVLVLERENSPFDKPFVIMERIKGQMLWPLLLMALAFTTYYLWVMLIRVRAEVAANRIRNLRFRQTRGQGEG